MSDPTQVPQIVQQPVRTWWQDLMSERMVFGILIIVGFNVLVHEIIYEGTKLAPEIISIVSAALGALATAIGIIVQAIWKTDKTDKQNAAALTTLANVAASQTGDGNLKQ